MSDNPAPRVYLACLASYNEGMLHGDWVELDGSEDIYEQLHDVLESSPIKNAEEWAIHDHEYCGHLEEYAGLQSLEAIKQAYERCEAWGVNWNAFVGWCEHTGHDIAPKHAERCQESFAGCAESLEDWAADFLKETGALEGLPEPLQRYFNTAAYARDLELQEVFTIREGNHVLVFWHS